MEQNNNEVKHTTETPRIYVASLADYNAGRLHGRWVDADQPAETIHEQIAQMLAESKEPGGDWAIHDYEHFSGLELSEFEDIEWVAQVAFEITQHGPVFASLVSYLGGVSEVEEARRYMEEGYRGEFSSLTDYAQDLVEDCYADVLKNLPEFIKYHIDYEGIANDMDLGGDVFTFECEGKVHVFDAHS